MLWTELFEVGHAGLDAEHHHLVELINRVYALEADGSKLEQLPPLLRAIEITTIEHIRHEDSVLVEILDIDFEGVNEHLADHARSFAELERILRRMPTQDRMVGHELSRMLRDWFLEHSLRFDAHIKKALEKCLQSRS